MHPVIGAWWPHTVAALLARPSCPCLRTLMLLRVQRAPPPLRASAAEGGARRWWSVLWVALQRAVASSARGVWTMPPLPGAPDTLSLSDVLELASASAPSLL